MPTAAKVITALIVLGAVFVSIFLIVYFAIVGLILVPIVAGVAYLLFRGLVATAKDGKDKITNSSDSPQ
ncbi:MAG: hypothetical protein JJU03_09015 [Idiomarina sp.]|nr:hypothetical protein [Idiomarina sp.]